MGNKIFPEWVIDSNLVSQIVTKEDCSYCNEWFLTPEKDEILFVRKAPVASAPGFLESHIGGPETVLQKENINQLLLAKGGNVGKSGEIGLGDVGCCASGGN